jgi:lipooligosaccharide transport system permease protein
MLKLNLQISKRVWTVWARDKDVFMKTYKTNFIPPFLEPVLFLLALGYGLGFFIKEMDGVSYAAFIAPSLISIAIMSAASFECTYATYVRMRYQKTFDAITVTPVSTDEVIIGELLWGATKSFINGSIVLVVVTLLDLAKMPYALIILPLSFGGGLLFAAIAMCFTAIVPNIDSFNYYFYLLWTPMFLVCGTFFPIENLPSQIQMLAFFLPLTHLVNIARDSTLFRFEIDTSISLCWLVIAILIFFILAVILMRRKLIK